LSAPGGSGALLKAERAHCGARPVSAPSGWVPEYSVETKTVRIGAHDYRIRSLTDRLQFSDPDGVAERAGISSATWPLFGVVWPSGLALAEAMDKFPIEGKRILEVGCGIGLSSLVLKRRGADITASDYHPLAEEFLRHNALLNGLPTIDFQEAPWASPNPTLGLFDLIIGSDLLYEPDQPALLAAFLAVHAKPSAQIVLADPGRHRCGPFGSKMALQGYTRTDTCMAFSPSDAPPYRGRIMSFVRGLG
jgi:predicted nicotinamide N-methyase